MSNSPESEPPNEASIAEQTSLFDNCCLGHAFLKEQALHG
jgi:hypothetical protein